MSLDSIFSLGQSALELGLITSLTVLALFLSYSMLNVCDLSTDGCFTLGATVGAVVAIAGHPYLSIAAAMAAGIASGFITAILQTKMGINSLLAGIIVNTGLYSINIAVMSGSSILNMNKTDTVFTKMAALVKGTPVARQSKLFVAIIAVAAVAVILGLFLKTRLGLAIRATGDNPDMVRASSLNPAFTISVGLCLANAMTGLAGAMVGQYQKTVDINSGTGIVVIGLACLIIGETVLGRRSMTRGVLAALIGSLIYRFIYAVVFYTKIVPVECLKLLTAIIVALAIAAPSIQRWAAFQRRKAAAKGKGGN